MATEILTEQRPVFSWGAALAGAITATAVSLLLLALGSGIGLLLASPLNASPSAKALGIGAAVWVILAQMWGFAVGGYIAGRLGGGAAGHSEQETNFIDGAHGLTAWAIGVLVSLVLAGTAGLFAAGSVLGLGAAALSSGATIASRTAVDPTAYVVDSLFRAEPGQVGSTVQPQPPQPTAAPGTPAQPAPAQVAPAPGSPPGPGGPLTTAPAPTPPGGPSTQITTPQGEVAPTMMARNPQISPAGTDVRGEIGRVFATGLRTGSLAEADRNYMVRQVSERTGVNQEVAALRVRHAEQQVATFAKEAADAATKAGTFASFWSFMALLLGAVAATLGGVFGGNQRDEWVSYRTRLRGEPVETTRVRA